MLNGFVLACAFDGLHGGVISVMQPCWEAVAVTNYIIAYPYVYTEYNSLIYL